MESERKKKKKRKIRYSILFIPDVTTSDIRKFSLSHRVLMTICMGVLVLICAIIIYVFYLSNHMVIADTSIQLLREQLDVLRDENAQLETENEELNEKVAIMSNTINNQVEEQKSKEEEMAGKYMPTGFPLKGTASYTENETTDDGEPIVIFTSAAGTDIIPAGSGIVIEVTSDSVFGNRIVVDHGNGYVSYYRDFSTPCVEEGDEVTRSTVLYTIQNGGESMGYQITENGEMIDPLQLMEIYG